MEDFQVLYYFLFNGITDVTDEMKCDASTNSDPQIQAFAEKYIARLQGLQQIAEETYISQ